MINPDNLKIKEILEVNHKSKQNQNITSIFNLRQIYILFIKQSMSRSAFSRYSNASSKMLQQIANRSQAKIYRIEGIFNDEELRIIWNSLGLYISRNLRMGRGVNIPKFGVFTFSPPEVRLKGVTNQRQRDQQPRTPVFLIQKEFVKGLNLKTAIFYQQDFGGGLRPYNSLHTTGEVPITKMNLIEIATYSNMSKDAVELGLTRILKYIHEKLYSGGTVNMEIPNLGQLVSRNSLVAVKFNEYINRDTRNVVAKSVDEKKQKGNMSLTSSNLKKMTNLAYMTTKLGGKQQQFFEIDGNTRRFLQEGLEIHMDDSNMKRSTTNFDRSFASRKFDRTNNSLKDSQLFRMTQSAYLTKSSRFHNKQFNVSLKIIREWVNDQKLNAEESFNQFCNLVGKKTKVLTQNDVWNGCQQISVDMTEQSTQELFRILDANRDGFVTLDDWKKSIQFQSNNTIFERFMTYIKSKKYGISKVINLLGLEGIRKVNLFTLKNNLHKIYPALNEEQSLLLAKYLSNNQNEVQIERIIDILNIPDPQKVANVDEEWQTKFFLRLKRKLAEKNITEEQLQSKMRFYDKNMSGFIEQTDFKKILSQIGISITLSELIKIVNCVPLNNKNHLQYDFITGRLMQTEIEETASCSERQFNRILNEKIFSKAKAPFSLPISVLKLTSYLQSACFKSIDERQLLQLVRKIDLDENDEISEDDFKGYREQIKEKKAQKLCPLDVENLIIKLRQKSIKKKISFYDLFKKIDQNGNGFITRQEWMKNIDTIISYTENQKENIFNFMDKLKSKMIDYKTFLTIMNGNTNIVASQKYDWAQEAMYKLKSWVKSSNLTVEDAFKVVDNDGDDYLSEKDMHHFLTAKLKYQERQLSHVRIQKLSKMMDHYKRGKINIIDWFKLFNQNKNWIQDAKQQIGIVLSRMYPNLSDGYTTITQGDNKLLYSSFERWIMANKVLSGFMINQEILKYLYSELDSHKKGYLLEKDFLALFGSYNYKSQQAVEFIDFLSMRFKTCEEAYKFLSGYSNGSISVEQFKAAVKELFGNRFKESDCKNLWKNCAGEKSSFNCADFKKLYGNVWKKLGNQIDSEFPKDSWKYQDFSIIKGTTVRTAEHEYQQKNKMQDQCNKFINNLKDMILSSPKTLEQAFMQVDKEKTGNISNLSFKKVFRILNIALTSKQIDLLLNYSHFTQDNLINWHQFIKVLNLPQDKQKIVSRLSSKINHISDLLHYYMISPKDAFRKWNNPRSGYMSFEEFYKMMKDLFQLANQAQPEFEQIKEFFNYIDIRRDEQLDFQEWSQIFRNCNPPSLLMGTTPAPSSNLVSKKLADKEEKLAIRQKSIPLFRHSQEYQKFVNLIGRNRKYLQTQIQKLNTNNQAFINFKKISKIIADFCGQHKIKVDEAMVRNLIAFSMTGEKVDYHLLVSRFKDLNIQISQFPKRNIF